MIAGFLIASALALTGGASIATDGEAQAQRGAMGSTASAEAPPAASGPRAVAPNSLNRWARRIANNYPTTAMFLDQQGTIRFQLSVSETGRATACAVRASSGYSMLDEEACRSLIRYARFNPALDDAGQPVASTYVSAIKWTMEDTGSDDFYSDTLDIDYPAEALAAGLEGRTQVEIVVGEGERVVSCTVLQSSGHPALDKASCDGIARLDGGERVAGAYSAPARRTMTRGVLWELPQTGDDDGEGQVEEQ